MPLVPPPNTELSSTMHIMKIHKHRYKTLEKPTRTRDRRVLEFPAKFACSGLSWVSIGRPAHSLEGIKAKVPNIVGDPGQGNSTTFCHYLAPPFKLTLHLEVLLLEL